MLPVNNVSASQFNQTNQVIHRQKLTNQLIWNDAILRVLTKISTVNQRVQYNKNNFKARKTLLFNKVRNVLIKKRWKECVRET